MKWYNLNIGFRVSINSGAALLLYLPALFILYFGATASPVLKDLFIPAITALTGAFTGFLVRRTASDKTETAVKIETLKLNGPCKGGADVSPR